MNQAKGIAPKKGTGRGTGRGKARVKQRTYKEHCRIMRTTGHYTDDQGHWRQAMGEDKVRYQDGMQK